MFDNINTYESGMVDVLVYLFGFSSDMKPKIIPKLQKTGCRHLVIDTPEALLSSLSGSSPAVILFEFTRAPEVLSAFADIRSGYSSTIPLVCIDRDGSMENRLEMIRQNINDYLHYPFSEEEFVLKLQENIELGKKRRYRVTIVDDDPDYSEITRVRLEKAGFNVNLIADVEHLLDTLKEVRPDVIVMDLYLGNYNGQEITRLLRQIPVYEDIPIIYLSSESDADIKFSALNHGGDDFIMKSSRSDYLVKAISRCIERTLRRNARYTSLAARGEVSTRGKYRLFDYLSTCSDDCKGSFILVEVKNISIEDRHSYIFYLDAILEEIDRLVPGSGMVVMHVRLTDNSLGILSNTDNIDALQEQLVAYTDLLARRYYINDEEVRIQTAIGGVLINGDDHDYHDVLIRAQKACDYAWLHTREKVHVYESENRNVDEKIMVRWQDQISRALESDGFSFVFQPVVGLNSQGHAMYDVLLRMQDSSGETVEAQRFIPAAEELSLIRDIDRWVIKHGATALRKVQKRDHDAVFFLKVSVESLLDDEFLKFMVKLCQNTHFPAGNLVLELKELEVKGNMELVAANMDILKSQGVRFAIGGYGRNLMSAEILDELPISYIKIDGAFMCDLPQKEINQATIKTIASNAEARDVQTIATFVEDAESLAILFKSGVHYMQGNFLQKPEAHMSFDFNMQ